MKELKDYKNEVNKCSKCGLCESICPLFKIDPNDCVATRAIIDTVKGDERKFELFANSLGEKSILAQIECARLRYTRRVEKEVLFEPEFAITLSYYLAALAGETLTGQQKKADSCMQKYEWKLRKAKQLNAQEGAAEDEDNSQYYDVR